MKLPNWNEKDAHDTGYYLEYMTHSRAMAMEIVGYVFEDFLERTKSTVPNPERTENGGDDPANCLAILYGCQYDELVTDVADKIEAYLGATA